MHRLFRLVMLLSVALTALAAGGQGTPRTLPPAFAIRTTLQRPEGVEAPEPARLLFHHTDEKNMCALVIEADGARLVKVGEGAETVLAGPVAIPKESQLPVLVLRDAGRTACWVGAAKLEADGVSSTGGRAGRAAVEGGLALSALRVQPLGTVAFADDFMRAAGEPDAWTHVAGSWELDQVPNPTWSANAFRYLGRGDGACLATAGEWFWYDVAVSASVMPGEGCGAVGLAANVEDERNFLVFRWCSAAAPQREGRVELVHVVDGVETVLAQEAGDLDAEEWCEMALAARGDTVVALVDGRVVLRAAADLRCGKVGLYCRDAHGARFDDVRVASVTLSEEELSTDAARRVLPPRRASVAARFRTDRYMQQWASELGSWAPDGKGTYWHTGLFRGDFELVWDTDEAMLFEQGPLTVLATGDDRDPAKGITLTLTRTDGALRAHIARPDVPAVEWQVTAPLAVNSLVLQRQDGETALVVGGRRLGAIRDSLDVRQIGLQCGWTRKRTLMYYSGTSSSARDVKMPAVQNFECTSPLLLDYSFHTAPVDWRPDTGTWEVTSRWICLPFFTWLGGRSHEGAALWHKRRFSGDVIVDFYAAVMMNYGPYSGYDRYGDLNVTLCADGRDLSSGYTGQFGARANTTTRILRGDTVVAETHSILYPSRSTGAHQSWYHVRLEKRGSTVRLFVDNKLAGEYADPAPLTGARVALWTWNRGIMIARARVWAERDDGAPPAFGLGRLPAALADGAGRTLGWSWSRGPVVGQEPKMPEQNAPDLGITSRSHPSIFYGFDRGPDGFTNRTGEYGGRARWEPRDDGGCLRVENARTGGDFAVHLPLPRFDVAEYQRVAFDYRLPADVKINLYLRTLGRWHVVGLTAPTGPEFHAIRESRNISGRVTATSGLQIEQHPPVLLGQLPAVTDGTWQHADFDLLAALRKAHPGQSKFTVEDVHFGNWSNEGYLQCGFGGNRRGAMYWLDNVSLASHGPGSGSFTWGRAQSWAIRRETVITPYGPKAKAGRFEDLGSGTYFLSLADGRRRRFLVDVDPPAVESVEPKARAKAAPVALNLSLRDPGGSGIEPASVRVSVNGKPIPAILNGGRVTADLSSLRFEAGQAVSCAIIAADRAANAMRTPFRWQWTYDRSLDKSPPSPPVLTSPASSDWDEDFEAPSDEWGRFPGSPWVEVGLDESTASSGRRCLRIEGGPGQFRCYVRRRAFDFKVRPTLSFDYLVDPRVRWSLAFQTDTGWRSYRPRPTRKGASTGWQHVDLRVDRMLAVATRGRAPVVKAIAVFGYDRGTGRTTVVRLDALRLLPAVFTARDVSLRWGADDVSGIAGYSFVLDREPDTAPDTTVDCETGEGVFPRVSSSAAWFHCRALDRAGNWGPTLHQPLVVQRITDEAPPQAGALSPKKGARASADTIRIRIADAGAGLAAESFRLHVDGVAYGMESPEIQFLPAQGEVTWTARRRPAFPDGKTIACRLEASDYAGNVLEPRSWSWTMDFAQDKTPPPAPFVSWAPTGARLFQDFERDHGQWMGRREGWAERTDEAPATGAHCVSFGGMSTFMHYERYDAGEFPIVGFDYRIEPGSQFNLMCRVENRNWEIQFTGAGKYPSIGTIPGIVADGKWHSCRFDLAAMLRGMKEPPRTLFVDHLATQNRKGEPFYVDNFTIARGKTTGASVRWSVPRDATGIRGYSVVLDHKPDTAPDETVDGAEPGKEFETLEPGTWYVHVRACDGAGNWGSAAHVRIDVPER